MFCSKCGKQLSDDSAFCRFCGAKVDGASKAHPLMGSSLWDDIPSGKERDGQESEMRAVIGSHADYYLPHFQELRETGKGHINWASFFLGLLHASYRGVWKKWLYAMRFPLIAWLAAIVLLCLTSAFFPLASLLAFPFLSMGLSLWLFIKNILTAKQFNRMYMDHVETKVSMHDQTPDPSGRRVFLTVLAEMAVMALFFCGMLFGLVPGWEEGLNPAFDDAGYQADGSREPSGDFDTSRGADDFDDDDNAYSDYDTDDSDDGYFLTYPDEYETGYEDEDDTSTSRNNRKWNEMVDNLMSDYIHQLVDAINHGDFSIVSDLFVPDGEAYEQHSMMIYGYNAVGATVELLDFSVTSSKKRDSDYGTVTFYNQLGIYFPNDEYEKFEETCTFSLERQSDDTWLLSDILSID